MGGVDGCLLDVVAIGVYGCYEMGLAFAERHQAVQMDGVKGGAGWRWWAVVVHHLISALHYIRYDVATRLEHRYQRGLLQHKAISARETA